VTEPDFEIPFDRLPERFTESVSDPPATPTPARPAATIALLREGADGVEVLLVRRHRQTGFVPGAWVFPGGRVDAADAADGVMERLDGLTADAAARRLGLNEGAGAIAYYVAALREAFEETGILVALDAEGRVPSTAADDDRVEALRDALLEDRIGLADVLDELASRLDGGTVEYIAHWITPEVERRRYDTRFFAARVAPGSEPVIDGREMTDAVWLAPADALARNRRGTLPMVFPTIRTLEQLATFDRVDAALATLATLDVQAIQPKLVLTPKGLAIRIPPPEDPRRQP